MMAVTAAQAQGSFALDFSFAPQGSLFFGITGTTSVRGVSSIQNQTPFMYETVTDPATNLTYYHMVLGEPSDGFAQDVYIQSSNSFGSFQGGPSSASLASINNFLDPLNVDPTTASGVASGNPKRVMMRQVMSGTDISSEFLKATANKPKITQDVTSTDMTAHVVIDMSNSDYSTMNVPGIFTNTLDITNAGVPGNAGSFNAATDSQHAYVTAGRYTYTPQTTTSCNTYGTSTVCNNREVRGGAGGTYAYYDGSANYDGTANSTVKWTDFWDPTEANPWVNTTNRP